MATPRVSECRIGGANAGKTVCSQGIVLEIMRRIANLPENADPETIVRESKKTTKCSSESCVIQSRTFRECLRVVNPEINVDDVLGESFNPPGPFDNSTPIHSGHIEDILNAFTNMDKTMLPLSFEMLNFLGSSLHQRPFSIHPHIDKLDWIQCLEDGYRVFPLILNTDTLQGVGKHWFCMLIDLRPIGSTSIRQLQTTSQPITPMCSIEFFNSSGNPPSAEIHQLNAYLIDNVFHKHLPGIRIQAVQASNKRYQYSTTECGMYSFYYILERLRGVPYTWFWNNNVSDEDVHALRRVLFRHSRDSNE